MGPWNGRGWMAFAAGVGVVLALHACGGSSKSSSPGALAPPSPVTATASLVDITVDWPLVSGATGYNLYFDTNPNVSRTSGTPVPGASTPFVHSGLTLGATYYYVVTSLRGTLEGTESGEASALFAGPPPPLGVAADPDDSLVTIDWLPATGVTGYNLYFDTNPNVTRTSGTQIADVNSPFPHTPLSNGTTYYYVLTSFVGAVEGVESAEVSATPMIPAGILDLTFGGQGWVTHDGAGGANWRDEAHGLSIDSAGRILVTGYSMTPGSHSAMVVWRLNDDGTLDTNFNTQGWVVFDGGGGLAAFDEGWSVLEDSTGGIIVAGTYGVDASNQDMAIWRYLADGTPDTNFGTNGLVSHDGAAGDPGGEDFGSAMLLDGSGRIVVGGSSPNTRGDWDMVVWRYLPGGTLDTNFGNQGIFVHDSAAGGIDGDEALNLTQDSTGRLVATGYSTDILGDVDMATWRLDTSGQLDATFGAGAGFVTHHDAAGGGGEDYGEGIVVETSGRILVSGISTNSALNFDMVIWAYDDSGTLDGTYGNGGIVVHGNAAGGNSWDDGLNVALDRFGRAFVTGFSVGLRFDWDMLVWGYDTSGSLDPRFVGGGLFIHDNGAGGMGDDVGNALIIDSQDRILVAGSSLSPATAEDLIIWRIK